MTKPYKDLKMYNIYINTNDILKKAIADLLINTDIKIVDKKNAQLIISEKNIVEENVNILLLGKDIPVPFKLDKLLKIIKYQIDKQDIIIHNDIKIEIHKSIIYYNNKKYLLTEKELQIFIALINNKKLSVKKLLDIVWGYAQNVNSNTVATHINKIRKKIDTNIIKTDKNNNYFIN